MYNYNSIVGAPGPQGNPQANGSSCYGDCTYSYSATPQPSANPSLAFTSNFLFNWVSLHFYISELNEGGCLNTFLNGMDQADLVGKLIPSSAQGSQPDDLVRMGAQQAAFNYAASNTLTVPFRSSVVRDILESGEKGAGAVGPALFDAQAGFGLYKEATAAYNGTCH